MVWLCTSKRRPTDVASGFGVIELLMGLSLALCLAVAIAPLVISLQREGVEQADRSVQALQARVALARFERDLRLAGGAGCPFPTSGALLDAGASRVVFLASPQLGSTPTIVEWEIAGSRLMRRWGACPSTRPAVYATSLFVDSKTMLEGVGVGSRLTYFIGERVAAPPLGQTQLAGVDKVVLELRVAPLGLEKPVLIATTGRVGR